VVSAAGFSDAFASGFASVNGGPLIPNPGIGSVFGNNGASYASAGENLSLLRKATDSHQVSGTLSKVFGHHTATFGGGFITNGFSNPVGQVGLGFAGGQTGNPNDPTQPGDPLASFLLNVPDNASRRNVDEEQRFGGVMSWFLQDSWKATPRLTVNAGLRYDLTFIPPYGTELPLGQQGGIETGDMNFNNGTYILQKQPPPCSVQGVAPCIPDIMLDSAGNAVSCNRATQTCLPPGTLPPHVVVDPRGTIAHNDSKNFGPRFGLAYRLGDNTVIRSGFGIVYDNWAAETQRSQNIEGQWPGIGQLQVHNLNQPTGPPTVTAQNPLVTAGAFPSPTPFNQVQWFYDPNIKNPYSEQWNLGIERELNAAITIDVNYVGSGTRRANVGSFYNTDLTPGLSENPNRRPFPYIGPTFYDRSIGSASYNALQFEMKKRYTGGLAYQVAYTYSKSLDEGSSGQFSVEGNSAEHPYNIKLDRGPSGYDLTHVLSFNAVYAIPVGKDKRFSTGRPALDYVLGNWQLNNIFSARSGLPFTVFSDGDLSGTGNVSGGFSPNERANQVGDPNQGSCPNGAKVGSVSCFFNTSAFAPALGTLGTSGRNKFRSAPYWDVDLSIFRQFPFGETRRFEFRAEAFNLFNNVIFGTPGNDVSSPLTFGVVRSAASTARQLQFGAKIIF